MTDREKVALCPWCGSEPVVRPNVGTQIRYAMCEKKGCPLCQQHTIFTLEEWNDRAAALRPEAQRVKIKPLEWRDEVYGSVGVPPFKCGSLAFWVMEHNGRWRYMGAPETYATREEAMAAAQAEYKRRILSALDRPEAQDALPIETAPKDHTFVHLLVRYTNPETWAPLEDAKAAWTIGMNGYDDTGEDVWQFVGWSWTQDCFLDRQSPGDGEPIGWLPMRSLPKVED